MLAVVVVAIAWVLLNRQDEAMRAAWRRVGERLGLEQIGTKHDPGVRGVIDGIAVEAQVQFRTDDQGTRTVNVLRCDHQSTPSRFALVRQGVLSALGRFAGRKDTEVGDPLFDRRVIVEARDPEAITQFLTPARRAAVLEAFDAWGDVVISNNVVQVTRRPPYTWPADLQSDLLLLANVGAVLADPAPLDAALATFEGGDAAAAIAALQQLDADRSNRVVARVLAEVRNSHRETEEAHRSPDGRATDQPGKRSRKDRAQRRQRRSSPERPPPPLTEAMGWLDVMADVFGEGQPGHGVAERFTSRHKGRPVRWAGTVEWVRANDPQTGTGAAARATAAVALGTIDGQGSIPTAVTAVVTFVDHTNLTGGDALTFTGTLGRVDRLTRRFHVEDGRIVT